MYKEREGKSTPAFSEGSFAGRTSVQESFSSDMFS